MEPGNPTMQVIMHLDHSLSVLLNLGVDRIQDHARDLATYTTEGLKKLGFDVMSSSDREAMSGNTTFRIEDAERVVSDLKKKDILLWGEFGRVRVSTHVHNGTADVDRLMDALKVYA
jgi:selenocysteine lyase/cysteine desulfurase